MTDSPPFYPPPLPIPTTLTTAECRLEPLTPAHVALDYAALMAGKEMLRLWSGSPWPQDNFTLADNRADLQWHWDEHRARIAFTYTVLNTAQTTCLGCVYIKPLTDISVEDLNLQDTPSPRDALIRFWVTPPFLASRLDTHLLETLRDWFKRAWHFDHIYFHTRRAYRQQLKLFQDSDLRYVDDVQISDRGGIHALFIDAGKR